MVIHLLEGAWYIVGNEVTSTLKGSETHTVLLPEPVKRRDSALGLDSRVADP